MYFYALFVIAACSCFGQASQIANFVGIAVGATKPESPIAVPIQIQLTDTACTLTVSPPLLGSGPCLLKAFDERTGRIEIVSAGAAIITWTGTVKGNFASGSYRVDGAQIGTFYLAVTNQRNEAADSKPTSTPRRVAAPESNCALAIESAITGDIEGWDGETIFKLDNGQIWQQAEYDYTYFYEYHPDVTIYQTSRGCRMKVEDEEETILVKRIK